MRNILILFLFLSIQSFSQEILLDLVSNPNLRYVDKHHIKKEAPLSIPFIDDFSINSSSPDSLLWEDRSVFVNRNYAINPITIGVATFDGLNKFGRPYDISLTGTDSENADTLTSHKIDLSFVDTAYIMFFYQAQGLGNDPQVTDSIILEFSSGIDSSGNNVWGEIWKIEGSSFFEFKKFVLVFFDTLYLRSDFQFRFRNLASVTGNFDHWNIDYIKVDEYNTASDTSIINDVSFVNDIPMLLNRYREMPWVHFVNDVSLEMNDSIHVILRNNTNIIQSIDYRYDVFKNNTIVFHYPVDSLPNSTRNVDVPAFSVSGLYTFNSPPVMLDDDMFPVSSSDSAEFIVRSSIKTEPSDFKNNDTIYHTQRFYSHFSYDDGTAESAYGINVQGAKLAYEFKLNRPDTLRMVQMKFVEMHEDISNTKFALTVWDENNGVPGQELYKDTVEIQYQDRGQFTNYYLDHGVGIIGTFFVGWEQITDDILNLGLDKNSIANDNMIYNVGGGWVHSQFPGAWMIRPVVSYNEPIVSSIPDILELRCKIFPNPFDDQVTILFYENKYREFRVLDITGRIVRYFGSSDSKVVINKEDLHNGVYFIQILEGDMSLTKKIILQDD